MEKRIQHNTLKASNIFIFSLALVSIVSFIGIISETLFNYNIAYYTESFLMLIMGVGFILESQIGKIKNIKTEGLTSTNFAHLTTFIIGIISIIAGILSIPLIRVENSGFLAIKGIISIIAIIIIIIQTWVVE